MAKEEPDVSEDDAGGNIACAGEYGSELGELAEFFDHRASLSEAARFAMAIGIQKGIRVESKDWKKGTWKAGKKATSGKTRNLAHLGSTFSEDSRWDIETLFDMLNLRVDGVPLNTLISEYITGGMKWIVENEVEKGVQFSRLKAEFPHLFSE